MLGLRFDEGGAAMKLTKRDRQALVSALEALDRGYAFLMHPDTLVCRKRRMKTTTLDFENDQGQVYASIDKLIGSDLALLATGIERLRVCLAPADQEPSA